MRCAALLRVAEQLERARDQAVRHADVTVEDGRVRLELRTREDDARSPAGAPSARPTCSSAPSGASSPSSADDGEPARAAHGANCMTWWMPVGRFVYCMSQSGTGA